MRPDTGLINYEQIESLAEEHRPKMIVAGFSAYSRIVDWARLRAIADSVGALLFVDMAHVAGLVAAGLYPNPLPHADVVTTTTHKTLRGPRGGLILARANDSITKKLNSMVFPGTQGGPLMHVIAAKAVALLEALQTGIQAIPAPGARQRARDGGALVEARLPHRLRRHRQPSVSVEPDRPQHHRQGRGCGAGPAPISRSTRTRCRTIRGRR